MKKIFFLPVLLFFLFGCTVNEYTALIRITNSSNKELKNIKIGDTFITCYVGKGAVYDYWAITTFKGVINLEGADYKYKPKKAYVTVKSGWIYSIYATMSNTGATSWRIEVDKSGTGGEKSEEVLNDNY